MSDVAASPANTAKFGGEQNKAKIYRDKLLEELEKFLCGDQQYEDDRNKIAESTDKSQKYIIGVMAIFLGLISPVKADGPSVDANLSGVGDRQASYGKAKSGEGRQ
mgnify:CR=1 FL=1